MAPDAQRMGYLEKGKNKDCLTERHLPGGSAQVPERANANCSPPCVRLKGFVARGLSPNGDGNDY